MPIRAQKTRRTCQLWRSFARFCFGPVATVKPLSHAVARGKMFPLSQCQYYRYPS
nr:MAG TPA: hypothetical protein [Caudoviricetes sp.]